MSALKLSAQISTGLSENQLKHSVVTQRKGNSSRRRIPLSVDYKRVKFGTNVDGKECSRSNKLQRCPFDPSICNRSRSEPTPETANDAINFSPGREPDTAGCETVGPVGLSGCGTGDHSNCKSNVPGLRPAGQLRSAWDEHKRTPLYIRTSFILLRSPFFSSVVVTDLLQGSTEEVFLNFSGTVHRPISQTPTEYDKTNNYVRKNSECM